MNINPLILYLHSTLVRFYEKLKKEHGHQVLNLHSTLVRFYGGRDEEDNEEEQYLHSTLVRFYVRRESRSPPIMSIYIPHWLDSMP